MNFFSVRQLLHLLVLVILVYSAFAAGVSGSSSFDDDDIDVSEGSEVRGLEEGRRFDYRMMLTNEYSSFMSTINC
jgi:hypothetical protein